MNRLMDFYYDGVVISNEIDPNHAGGVRVKILGVTDGLKDEDQPFAIPASTSSMAVPTKGSLLEIIFDEGDVNKPKYFGSSVEGRYLPREYVDGYPNIAMTNLGGDLFTMFHDRKNKNTLITHPSNSAMIWDDFGKITHDSVNGYDNAGLGANDNRGSRIHSVLTEATIDVATCTPFGRGSVSRGSEYMGITHISKGTVDAVNGTGGIDSNTDADPFEPSGVDTSQVNQLLDAEGNFAGEVTFIRSPSIIELNDERKPTTIIIGISGNEDFVLTSKTITDKNTQLSAHYVVGKSSRPPDTASQGSDGDNSGGFAQFVELKNDATFGNTIPSKRNILTKANKDAISIMLIGTDPSEFSRTAYQNNTINIIKEHVKQNFKITDQDFVIQDVGFLG